MSLENGVVVSTNGEAIYWHTPKDRQVAYLPDSKDLWQVMWDNREQLSGFAHSHPGVGCPTPSWEDITTFSSVDRALGQKLVWWIITEDQIAEYQWKGPGKYDYERVSVQTLDVGKYTWLAYLHSISYGGTDGE